jgi:hypothetical protein
VLLYEPPDVDEKTTRTCIARKLAALKGYDFAGEYDPAKRYGGGGMRRRI